MIEMKLIVTIQCVYLAYAGSAETDCSQQLPIPLNKGGTTDKTQYKYNNNNNNTINTMMQTR